MSESDKTIGDCSYSNIYSSMAQQNRKETFATVKGLDTFKNLTGTELLNDNLP